MYEYSRVRIPLSNLGRTCPWHPLAGVPRRQLPFGSRIMPNPALLEGSCRISGVGEQGRTNLVTQDTLEGRTSRYHLMVSLVKNLSVDGDDWRHRVITYEDQFKLNLLLMARWLPLAVFRCNCLDLKESKSTWPDCSYLVDPASSHMLVSKIKPCMSKYKRLCTVKLRMAH